MICENENAYISKLQSKNGHVPQCGYEELGRVDPAKSNANFLRLLQKKILSIRFHQSLSHNLTKFRLAFLQFFFTILLWSIWEY